jgi:hypothetical protein
MQAVQTASVAINEVGKVAFVAGNGPNGIYTGDNPLLDKVISRGDRLFDSTLSSVQSSVDINNRGDIAFQYALANGVYGIAVARVVPEPRSAFLAVVSLAFCARRSRGAHIPGH